MKQLEKLKINNIMSVLEFMRLNENCSKKFISSSTGLSSTLLTNICNHLKEKNLIIEGDVLASNRAGRKEIALNINYSLKKIIGINISSEYCEIVISDLKPSLLFSKRIPTNLKDGDKLMESIFSIIFSYMENNSLSVNDFAGIGVSSKGTTDVEKGIIGEDFLEKKLEIKEHIKEKINLPVFIENDVKSLSVAQNFFFPEYDDFFLIKYTIHGIGGALFKDGTLYTNKENIVGRIGHIIIDPKEDYCPVCKRKGCLESIISINRIKKELEKNFNKKDSPVLAEELNNSFGSFNINKLFSAFEKGSIQVNNILRKSASLMAQSIINTYALTGSSNIVLYGDFFSYKSYMFLLEQYIKEYQLTEFWDKITLSKLSPEQETLASCVVVIKKIFYEELNKYFHLI
ncbi:ROK family protein [Fusobacterium perfoetens]|uniref:ROK family protein n=1 Tax=Fusobacterium perfoetens TaxID=852 RepID=UPI001F3A9EA1|nr:ROK family protein [Fusobacterium perfoetens]MCF2625049.1 ROK family protein [Fusobacterium perfoetens]